MSPPTVLLSDTHAGPGLSSAEWLDDASATWVCNFLELLAVRNTPTVLLGDIWERQVVPCDIQPPTMAEVLTMGPAARVFKAVTELAAVVPVTYVVGNHDSGMTKDLLPPGVIWGGDVYVSGDLRAEHGHVYTLFNSADPAAPDQLPLGYFISRLVASCTSDYTPTLQQIVTELIEMGEGKDTLPEALIDAIAAKAKLGPDDVIRMPNDLWGAQIVTVKHVRDLYKDLASRFEKAHGILAATIGIPADKGHLGPAAAELFAMTSSGMKSIVFGHTHKSELETVLGRTYANTGSWSAGCKPTWVEYEDGKLSLKQL